MENKNRLKIAFVQRLLPLYRLGFYKELARLNTAYDITIICPFGEDTGTHIKTISPEVFNSATNDNKHLKWVNSKVTYYYKAELLWQSGIIGALWRKEYDILFLINKMSHLFHWLLILICKVRGIKLVFWSHGLQGKETGFKLALKRWFLSLPDVNLIYAHYSQELLVKSGIKPETIQIVYNSLDFSEQDDLYNKVIQEDRAALKKAYLKNDQPVIIFLGRLEKRKKVDMMLRAAELLKNRGLNVNVVIAGDGAEAGPLKALTEELKLNDWVYFLGRVEEPELVKYFYFSDVSVSPGNVGLNCIHSLNYGVPVITHNDLDFQFPEVEVLINNETGIFFRHNDVEDLANKIEYWLKNHINDHISEKLRSIVKQKYSPVVQAQCFLDGIDLLYK